MVNASIARSRRRSRERGAAVFIVVLVITMLTAIGLFAAHAATLSTVASGHQRRMTQTHYLTEYAMHLAIAEIERHGSLDALRRTSNANCSVDTTECWSLMPHTFMTGQPLVEQFQDNVPPTHDVPGSLGYANINWSARVEVTDPIRGMSSSPGSDQTGADRVNVDYCLLAMSGKLVTTPADLLGGGATIATAGAQESMTVIASVLCSK